MIWCFIALPVVESQHVLWVLQVGRNLVIVSSLAEGWRGGGLQTLF